MRARRLDPNKEDLEEFLNTTAAPGKGLILVYLLLRSSCRASGLPSKGMHTSINSAERPSRATMVRSERFAPVVFGKGCSLNLSPIDGGIARINLSRTTLWRSWIRPMLCRQWLVIWGNISGTLTEKMIPVQGHRIHASSIMGVFGGSGI